MNLDVTVTRVVYPRENEAVRSSRPVFTILLTNRGKCVGALPFRPAEGAKLTLTGDFEAYHGERNFRFAKCSQDIPQDPHALLQYVCKVGKGLGPATAERIWTAHGAEWRDHIDELSPAVSLTVRRTLDALNANRDRLDLAVECIRLGLGASVSGKAWEMWGAEALATIRNDPYLLASLPGVGFKTADALGKTLGIGDADQRRAAAAVDYAIRNAMEQSGNSILQRDAVYNAIGELGVPRTAAALALAKMVANERIVFVGMDKVTTSQVVKHEGDLARYMVSHQCPSCSEVDVVWPANFTPDPAQVDAVMAAVRNEGVTVINGGAGCGKTTIIRTLTEALESSGAKVSLCAFAGKAAARLREATDHPASTIHSLLGYMGEGQGFTHGDLEGETVILDEASMVPSSLLYEITKRNPKRLVLVGDQAQLQPVGIGSPFHDVIDSLPTVVHTLTTCYRNKEAVFAAALDIRNGIVPEDAESRSEKFDTIRFADAESIHKFVCDAVREGSIDFSQDLVLSPRNGEGEEPAPCTVKSVNADVQNIVNPHAPGQKFKFNDRVMCVKNFSQLDIWNGTCGWISRINTDGVPWFAPDDGGEVPLKEKEQRENIVPAYCLTVHKSQGSQYRDVYVIALKRDEHTLLDRSMLYTAVTRAKRACHILTDDGVHRIIATSRRRSTYLQRLLKGEI